MRIIYSEPDHLTGSISAVATPRQQQATALTVQNLPPCTSLVIAEAAARQSPRAPQVDDNNNVIVDGVTSRTERNLQLDSINTIKREEPTEAKLKNKKPKKSVGATVTKSKAPKITVKPNFRRKNRELDKLDLESQKDSSESRSQSDGFMDRRREWDNDEDDEFGGSIFRFDDDHPALSLPPVDVLLLVDASSSIGNRNFEEIKYCLRRFTNEMDISAGRSRVAVILFAGEPQIYFGFHQYYTNKSVSAAIRRMPYLGGPTFFANALMFSAGVLSQEQRLKRVYQRRIRFLPTPRHDRPQVMIVVSDGISDDNFDRSATHLHERLYVKLAAIVTKSYNRERLQAVTRSDGAVFTLGQVETLTIWLWNVQKMWKEKYGDYVKREKSFQHGDEFSDDFEQMSV